MPDEQINQEIRKELEPDIEQLVQFIFALLKNTNGYIQLRAFTHDDPSLPWGGSYALSNGKRRWVWPSAPANDLERVAIGAAEMAKRCANAPVPAGVVFAPPICALNNPLTATTADIAECPVLSVECDGPDEHQSLAKPPDEARRILERVMGKPTLAMASGGIWTDPRTGEQQSKWHVHYRLRQPTRSPEDHAKLREARDLLAHATGSDTSAIALVHPLRWAGSWNTKREPRLATITELNTEIDISLNETLLRLRKEFGSSGVEQPKVNSHDLHGFVAEPTDLTYAKIEAALQVIPNNVDYDGWINVGMAVKSGLGDAGYTLFEDWSRTNSKFNDRTIRKKWSSFKASGSRTVATVYGMADDHDPSWRKQFREPTWRDRLKEMPGIADWYTSYITDPPTEEELQQAYREAREDPELRNSPNSNPSPQKSQCEPKSEPESVNEDLARWSEPLDIFGALTHEPVITADMLPAPIRAFVVDQAELLGCDIGAMGMTALVICAALISDAITIQPKRHNKTYTESARLWLLLIGNISNKKSPMLKILTDHIRIRQAAFKRLFDGDMERYRNRLDLYTEKRRIWLRQRAEAESEIDPPERPEKPREHRLLTNDFTNEALAEILRDNPRGIMVLMDEIMALFGGFDAYKKGNVNKDRPITLEGYNGGPRDIDRKSSKEDRIHVANWSFGIVGGIQHSKLDDVGIKLGDDGLLQRFILLPMQARSAGIDRAANEAAITSFTTLLDNLIGHDPPLGSLPAIQLSDGAQSYREQVEELSLAFDNYPGVSEAFQGFAGKLGGTFARLLLTIHVIENCPLGWAQFLPQDEEQMTKKFQIVSEETARRAYDLITKFILPLAIRQYERLYAKRPEIEDVRWLARHILAKRLGKIDERTCRRATHLFEKFPNRARAALDQLNRARWLEGDAVNPRVHVIYAEVGEVERQAKSAATAAIKQSVDTVKRIYTTNERATT